MTNADHMLFSSDDKKCPLLFFHWKQTIQDVASYQIETFWPTSFVQRRRNFQKYNSNIERLQLVRFSILFSVSGALLFNAQTRVRTWSTDTQSVDKFITRQTITDPYRYTRSVHVYKFVVDVYTWVSMFVKNKGSNFVHWKCAWNAGSMFGL